MKYLSSFTLPENLNSKGFFLIAGPFAFFTTVQSAIAFQSSIRPSNNQMGQTQGCKKKLAAETSRDVKKTHTSYQQFVQQSSIFRVSKTLHFGNPFYVWRKKITGKSSDTMVFFLKQRSRTSKNQIGQSSPHRGEVLWKKEGWSFWFDSLSKSKGMRWEEKRSLQLLFERSPNEAKKNVFQQKLVYKTCNINFGSVSVCCSPHCFLPWGGWECPGPNDFGSFLQQLGRGQMVLLHYGWLSKGLW